MNIPISSIIEMHFNTLTKSERLLATMVLEQQKLVCFTNISKLAKLVGVGEATIVRFCKKIGFDGYIELRDYLHQEQLQQEDKQPLSIALSAQSSYIDLAHKLHQLNMVSLDETCALLNNADINHAVTLLQNAKNIYLYGLGNSSLIALEGKFKFMRIGLRVDACTDEHLMLVNSSLVTGDDLIIAISNSGQSMAVVKSLAQAKQQQAKTIVITKYLHSAITEHADILLLHSGIDDGLEIGSSTIKTSQVFLLDLLYNAYLFNSNGNELTWLQKTKNAFIPPLPSLTRS